MPLSNADIGHAKVSRFNRHCVPPELIMIELLTVFLLGCIFAVPVTMILFQVAELLGFLRLAKKVPDNILWMHDGTPIFYESISSGGDTSRRCHDCGHTSAQLPAGTYMIHSICSDCLERRR